MLWGVSVCGEGLTCLAMHASTMCDFIVHAMQTRTVTDNRVLISILCIVAATIIAAAALPPGLCLSFVCWDRCVE